ncbi:MAG: GntR family transcriptional regulator [Alphaproteobacteria bacterium]|nr:MAG: GntR family transcriptional regulator [Alphaproteobacteria bacterium]
MSLLGNIKPIDDRTIRRQVVQKLKDLIVAGKLEPGQRLTEQELARSLGVSRGPLREAIRELIDIGLLTSIPYKGLFVRSFDRKDLEEIYSLRTALEQFAFQQCWNLRTEKSLADLRQRNHNLIETVDRGADPERAIEEELILHGWCYELANHTLLLRAWERLKPNLQFYFSLHQQAHSRAGPFRQAHEVYVALACGNDLEAMLAHLADHMRQGLETTISRLETPDIPKA